MSCQVPNCGRPVRTRGYCKSHYMRWWRCGDPNGTRPHRPATRSPTARELEWAAGFLEGEGSFPTNGNGCEVVSVAQVNREPIDRIVALFGGAHRHRAQSTIGGAYYQWQISGVRARGVMLTLYSLLSARRQEQIRNALATRHQFKRRPDHLPAKAAKPWLDLPHVELTP